jgi:hypothetical protein
VRLSSISVESGNVYFVIVNDLLIDVLHHVLIRNCSSSSNVEIPFHIEMFGCSRFSFCSSLSSVSFESNSRLTRIESTAFSYSSLQSIVIPRNVEILGSACFSNCQSLSSISFESNSPLTRIESKAFDSLKIVIVIPSAVLFVAFDVIHNAFEISIADWNLYREFHCWQQLIKSGLTVDFRGILKIRSEFADLIDYLIDISSFETRSMDDDFEVMFKAKYERCEDDSSLVVKSVHKFKLNESLMIQIENFLNSCHLCILSSLGFMIGRDSTMSEELKLKLVG